jgi:hypothetical protein
LIQITGAYLFWKLTKILAMGETVRKQSEMWRVLSSGI